MATEADILAILTGRKQFDGNTWRVYDALNTELTDSGGALWRGVHGALLWNQGQTRVAHDWIVLARRRGRR